MSGTSPMFPMTFWAVTLMLAVPIVTTTFGTTPVAIYFSAAILAASSAFLSAGVIMTFTLRSESSFMRCS